MARRFICGLTLFVTACVPAAPLGQAEVQEFVRVYVAASNAGDASKIMELISREANVSSIERGKIDRGWEAIRTATDKNISLATTGTSNDRHRRGNLARPRPGSGRHNDKHHVSAKPSIP